MHSLPGSYESGKQVTQFLIYPLVFSVFFFFLVCVLRT